jgi:PKD repeat protein
MARVARSRAELWLLALLVPVVSCEDLPAAPDTNVPPEAAFYFTPVSPVIAGQSSVQFNAAGSRDEDGTIQSYTWDFGDGTPRQASDTTSMRHTFPDTPARCIHITYGVSLTVTDDKGTTGVAALPVTVTELPAPGAPECR